MEHHLMNDRGLKMKACSSLLKEAQRMGTNRYNPAFSAGKLNHFDAGRLGRQFYNVWLIF